MVRVLPIHFGVVLGCKGGGGRTNKSVFEKFFQVQARYSTMPGFESLFWRGIRLQRGRGEETNFLGS